MKKFFTIVFVILLLFTCGFSVNAFTETVPYENYTYSAGGSVIKSPQGYLPQTVIYGHTLGIDDFAAARDIDCDSDGNLYILDEETNRVVILNSDLSLKKEINVKQTISDGTEITLLDARGITAANGKIYICDTENSRILIFNAKNGKYINMITTPESKALTKDFVFKPVKVAVDLEDNYYIVSNGTYEGIVNISATGEFLGFFAENEAMATTWELFWRRFSSVEQRKNSVQFVPQDLSSIDRDEMGFFFVTSATEQNLSMVKRVNPGGNDVIRNLTNYGIIGDVIGESSFIDVSAGKYKIYACLDSAMGRVFCYNTDGYLLYTFGSVSEQKGGFAVPSAITYMNDERIAVLDSKKNSITVFAPTEYAKAINKGVMLNNELRYDEAIESWRAVLKYNNNFEFAQNMIANSYYTDGKYKEAMYYFQQSNNKEMYSISKKALRSQWLNKNLKYIVIAAIIILCLGYLLKFLKWRKKSDKNGY